MHDTIPLAMLSAGSTALVEQVVGCASQVHRLHELGLRDGARLVVVQAGKPCIIRLNGHKLCFRDSESMAVLVRVDNPAACIPAPHIHLSNTPALATK